MIKDNGGIERYSLNTIAYDFLMRAKEKINNEDTQVLGIIWGNVGCGKSLLAQKLAFAVDPTLSIDRVCFDKNEFVEAVIHSKKKSIIADEGISMFFSRAAMTKDARLMQELMAQIRQKNLMVLICVPNLLTVDSLILDAANFAIGVWEDRKEINGRQVQTKGNAAVFIEMPGDPFKSRIIHYLKAKKSSYQRRVRKPLPTFNIEGNPIGETFKKPWYPVGEEEYRIKKESILKKYQHEKKEEKEESLDSRRWRSPKQIKEIYGFNSELLREWKAKGLVESILINHRNLYSLESLENLAKTSNSGNIYNRDGTEGGV